MDVYGRVIRKPSLSEFATKPNLESYEGARANFDWKKFDNLLEWFPDGKINAAYNAITRHIHTYRKNKVALCWEAPDGHKEEYSFLEMDDLSNRFANVLKKYGVKKGDRVFIFLPRVPQLFIAFLGILKAGAIAGTMFSAFGPAAVKDRLQNSAACMLITNSELKKRALEVKSELPELKKIMVIDNYGVEESEIRYQKEMDEASADFECEHMNPEDIAFMLYTSGTTGKPKGVVHAHIAILQEHLTASWVLDMNDQDVYWCTADPGWVTGIAYEILGSWSNGVTSVVYEGRFDPAKWYSIIQKYRVTVWYTAPTAIRMLMKAGSELPRKFNLSSLRHLCSVGEPLNPEAIKWGIEVFGKAFHDTWWQTETGAIVIANYPTMDIRPGSMGKPFPGIIVAILDDKGNELPGNHDGNLAIRPGWPSMLRGIWGNEQKYKSLFLNGWYISGDKAKRDDDGYFWFYGRSDDVIKTAGERVGPFEVESALIEHPAVVEAGVIGKPDAERGEIIKAFITLRPGFAASDQLKKDISEFVKKRLAGHAYPKEIEFMDNLPKTRSGKIMRRILKAKELGLPIGDTSTLEDY